MYGMLGHVGISFQESYGTVYTSSMDYAPIISEGISEDIEALSAEGMTGRFEEGDHYEGNHSIAGDIVMELHPTLAGKLLHACLGQNSGTLAGSVYTHEFVPKTSDWDNKAALPPMTLEIYRDSGSAYHYYDACLNQLAIEIANGAITKATAGFIGGNFAWANKGTPSYPTGSYYTFDVSSISVGGSAVDVMSQISITVNNQLEAKHTLNGSRFPSRIKRSGYRTVEIAGTLLFEDTVEAKNFRDQTLQQLIVTCTGPSITTSQNNVFKYDIPSMLYTAFPANIGGPGLIEVGFSAKAKYDSGSGNIGTFTMVNTKANY